MYVLLEGMGVLLEGMGEEREKRDIVSLEGMGRRGRRRERHCLTERHGGGEEGKEILEGMEEERETLSYWKAWGRRGRRERLPADS